MEKKLMLSNGEWAFVVTAQIENDEEQEALYNLLSEFNNLLTDHGEIKVIF